MKGIWKHTLKRAAALIVALMMVLTVTPVLAQETDPLSVSLNWTDSEGGAVSAAAVRLTYAGFENYFWAYLPADAPLDAVSLSISDASGRYMFFAPENGAVLSGLQDAGTGIGAVTPVDIVCYDGEMRQVATLHLYVSTQAQQPEQPSFAPPQVTVRFVNQQTGEDVASSYQQTCALGEDTTVTAPQVDGYHLVGSDSQTVTVDVNGNPSVWDVTFYYEADQQAVAPDVTIHCVDLNSNTEIYTTTQGTTLGQVNTIYAPTLEGYDLSGSGEETVTVDAQGNADKVEVTFYYTAKTYTAPDVTIHCVDLNSNTEIYTTTQGTTLRSEERR